MPVQHNDTMSHWMVYACLCNIRRMLCRKRCILFTMMFVFMAVALLNVSRERFLNRTSKEVHQLFPEDVRGRNSDLKLCHFNEIVQILKKHKHLSPMAEETSIDTKVFYPIVSEGQTQIDYIAMYLDVKFKILSNKETKLAQRITLTNTGNQTLGGGAWCIYYNIMHDLNHTPKHPREGLLLGISGFKMYNIRGFLRCFGPDKNSYLPIRPRETRTIFYNVKDFKCTRSDIFPNWYVTSGDLEPRILNCVMRTREDFVEPFTSPEQYKRYPTEPIDPFTAESRYKQNKERLKQQHTMMGYDIIPTPVVMRVDRTRELLFYPREWTIHTMDTFLGEAKYLSEILSVPISEDDFDIKTIDLVASFANGVGREGYVLRIDARKNKITIVAEGAAGAFYAIQSFLSIVHNNQSKFLPELYIMDKPRFDYRGVNCDVGHNFISKDEILKFIDAMAMYKMNKLHLHLTEDDGWRIQIPGLDELTSLGSTRCHDETETRCLMPQYGSGPYNNTSGTGFYTVAEYREILRYAKKRHVQVIPEIDTPGHSRAAIKSMELRRKHSTKAETDFSLMAENDKSLDHPKELYGDNTMDICLESTYKFIEYVFKAMKTMHEDIQPLKLFHIGGDEVSKRAWSKSEACAKLRKRLGDVDIKHNFLRRVTNIITGENVDVAAWDDIVTSTENSVYELKDILQQRTKKSNFVVYPWKHSSVMATRAIAMTKKGYKVVLSMADFLYLDQKYEADPYEPGLYWASRALDTKMPFSFIPEELYLYANFDTRIMSWLSRLIWGVSKPLRQNIAGIECHLWTETIHSSRQHQFMGFPRFLAVAERAWHKASWEDVSNSFERNKIRDVDWSKFAHIVGKQELKRLDKMGISYRIPPPGAIIEHDIFLRVNSEFPGLIHEYRTEGQTEWTRVEEEKTFLVRQNKHDTVYVRTLSTDGLRQSRVVSLR